jgi:hypothetical protein
VDARANPLAGQIALAPGLIEASVKPIFASTKYTVPTTRSSTT